MCCFVFSFAGLRAVSIGIEHASHSLSSYTQHDEGGQLQYHWTHKVCLHLHFFTKLNKSKLRVKCTPKRWWLGWGWEGGGDGGGGGGGGGRGLGGMFLFLGLNLKFVFKLEQDCGFVDLSI